VKRWTMLLATIWLTVAFTVAQESPALKPAPGHTEGILGPQLIAWSELQKPQPVPQQPQPVPPPDTQPSQQPSDQKPQPDAQQPDAQQRPQPETQESPAQSVTGSVVKVAGKYMLETEDNVAYQLDDQEKAKQYEGKRVKVTGSLDRTTGILHVSSIELLS
jgi:outer membrane biosynthesis protein TonB